MLQTKTELRRTTRRPFSAPVELTDSHSGERLQGMTGDIGTFGCSVKSEVAFPTGTSVELKITQGEKTFTATGTIAYILRGKGMGIAYGALKPEDFAVLQGWLAAEKP